MQLQLRIAHVRPQSILNARDGIDYPLSEAELQQELKKIKWLEKTGAALELAPPP
jgi:hypothetical protein